MKRTYEVRDRADKRAIREFLKREGQFLEELAELDAPASPALRGSAIASAALERLTVLDY